MRRKKKLCLRVLLAVQLMVILLALPNLLGAQEPDQAAGKDKPAPQDTSKTTDNKEAAPASPLGLDWADSYFRQIGRSGLLAGSQGGIGWGSLYIPSAKVSGIVEGFEASNTQPGSVFTAAVLQASVVYDHKIGNSRIALQYEPSIAFSEGQVIPNFSNQNTSLDVLIYARPRWNVRFSDNFRYYYAQQSFGFPYLDVNPSTAGAVTNTFLDGPDRWLSNTASLSIGYALSARTSISVTPDYTFSESGVDTNLVRGVSYGGSVNWGYRTSERQTLGFQYSGQLIHQSVPMTSLTSDSIYQTVAGTAARQLSATWFVRGALGVTSSRQSAKERQWYVYGVLGLVKQMGRSTIGLDYSRGDTLATGLISSQYADRVDATYQNQMNKRLSWGVGGGYLRQVQPAGSSAWYARSNAQFLLAPRDGVFATFEYFHKAQAISSANLYSGNRDIFSFGVLWQPGLLQR